MIVILQSGNYDMVMGSRLNGVILPEPCLPFIVILEIQFSPGF